MTYRGHNSVGRPSVGDAEAFYSFECGHCGNSVAGLVVAVATLTSGHDVRWLQCTICGQGSTRAPNGLILPARAPGPVLDGLPPDVAEAYEEARRCMSVGGYVATELVCRKILMHVAVEKGAEEGKTFAEYLSHLEAKGYVTPPMRRWVGLIRTRGNEANHELTSITRERAESTLMFTAELYA